MPSKLKAVDPAIVEVSKPKILISGAPNVGKTWVSMDFPYTYLIDVEGGACRKEYRQKLKSNNGMYFGHDEGSLSFENVINEIQTLAIEKHPYKTVTVDSISKLYYEEISREQERLGDKDAYGASKKPAVGFMRRLTSWANRLDMTVIMIAHSKALWGLDNKGQRSEIGTTFDAWDKLEYELDLWLEIIREGKSYYAIIRKSRIASFPIGERFPWSYVDFAERYGKDVIEKEVKPVTLITQEQQTELNALLEVTKLPEDQVDKWFKAAGVASWSEMDSEKVTKIITYIKNLSVKGKVA